jgi:hypothetical protein
VCLAKSKAQIETIKGSWATQKCTNNVYPVNVSSSKDEDDYTIMATIVKPTYEQNVSKLDTYALSENWHTQKCQCLVHPTLQGEQNVQDKVPPTNFTIEFIALSPPNKRPRTTLKSLIQLMGCASNGRNPLESLLIILIPNQHEIQLGGLRSGEEVLNAHS